MQSLLLRSRRRFGARVDWKWDGGMINGGGVSPRFTTLGRTLYRSNYFNFNALILRVF